jgi:hypothetical protein
MSLQIFTSKMSEGGINFVKTGKRGRVEDEVRQRVNECAPRKTRGVTQQLPETGEAMQQRPETGEATHLVTKQISRPTPQTTQLWSSAVDGSSQRAALPVHATPLSSPG